jgi:hypothetical protein
MNTNNNFLIDTCDMCSSWTQTDLGISDSSTLLLFVRARSKTRTMMCIVGQIDAVPYLLSDYHHKYTYSPMLFMMFTLHLE